MSNPFPELESLRRAAGLGLDQKLTSLPRQLTVVHAPARCTIADETPTAPRRVPISRRAGAELRNRSAWLLVLTDSINTSAPSEPRGWCWRTGLWSSYSSWRCWNSGCPLRAPTTTLSDPWLDPQSRASDVRRLAGIKNWLASGHSRSLAILSQSGLRVHELAGA
jgi:hypothetical protein